MRSFEELYQISVSRHGGADEVESKVAKPKTPSELKRTPDSRWLAEMTRAIFQAGFNWKVVDNMWPGFEDAFEGFDVETNRFMTPDTFDALTADKRIVRYPAKIQSVQRNASFIAQVAEQHGDFGTFIAEWPDAEYHLLLASLKQRGDRLGGMTCQYFLRSMGVESYILSKDVVSRLIAEGVIEKAPTSKGAMEAVQSAFNTWKEQSGRSLTEISRVVAMSI